MGRRNRRLIKLVGIGLAVFIVFLPIVGYVLSGNRGLAKRIGEDVLATISMNKTCVPGTTGSCVMYVHLRNKTIDRLVVPGFFTPPCSRLYGGTGLLTNNSLRILGMRVLGSTEGNESLTVRIPWGIIDKHPLSEFVVFLACPENGVYRVLIINK